MTSPPAPPGAVRLPWGRCNEALVERAGGDGGAVPDGVDHGLHRPAVGDRLSGLLVVAGNLPVGPGRSPDLPAADRSPLAIAWDTSEQPATVELELRTKPK